MGNDGERGPGLRPGKSKQPYKCPNILSGVSWLTDWTEAAFSSHNSLLTKEEGSCAKGSVEQTLAKTTRRHTPHHAPKLRGTIS